MRARVRELWVLEWKKPGNDWWGITEGHYTKDGAEDDAKGMREDNPDYSFRIVQYLPKESQP